MTARGMLGALLLAMLPNGVCGQQSAPTDQIPAQLRAPEGAKLIFHARAKGYQVYTCKRDAGQYSWTLKGPEAQLFDDSGKSAGRHSAGPTWQLNDGSAVTGKAVARFDPPDKNAVPWLLLTAADHSGNGLMSNVTHIQRLNTQGGKASTAGCDGSHIGTDTRVAYKADYFFYSSQP